MQLHRTRAPVMRLGPKVDEVWRGHQVHINEHPAEARSTSTNTLGCLS